MKTEHEHYLHVCPVCGRVEVYNKKSTGRCRKTVKKDGDVVDCQGEWEITRLIPEDRQIYEKAGSPEKAIKTKGYNR